MMTLLQLEAAALKCQTKLQALELVRRETASRVASFECVSEAHARTYTLGLIAHLAAASLKLTMEERNRLRSLFPLTSPEQAAA